MNTSSSEFMVVLVTAPPEIAEKIAQTVVQEKLAACVNLLPKVTSVYFWKDKLCQDQEMLMVIKTKASLFEALKARVVSLHTYDVPEVISFPIISGHIPYLNWITEATQR